MKHENGIEIAFRAGAPECTMNTKALNEKLHFLSLPGDFQLFIASRYSVI